MGRALRLGLAVLVAAGLLLVLVLVLQGRDRSTVEDSAGPGQAVRDQGADHRRPPPGFRPASDPPTSGPHLPARITRDGRLTRDQLLHALELGDVVLAYGDPADEGALRALQDEVAGPFDPALAAAGQAIVLDRRPGTRGVVALAWTRLLRTSAPDDPRLRAFAEAWLGRGAAG